MPEDERAQAPPLKPILERLDKAEKYVKLLGDALEHVVTAYDGFVDPAGFEPLVDTMKHSRDAPDVYKLTTPDRWKRE